ncbi:hypothetical protein [Rhodococcus sp. NPDC059234]|uniref:hypothetical protein n=1 Tax=Rhodococcus sp. NPDC059234 TaxID=3346781 RepID=UPI00366E03A7
MPRQARWQWSQAEFAAAVDDLPSGTRSGVIERRIGSYDVRTVRRHGDNVYFVVTDSGFLDDDGIAYLPDGEPATPIRSARACGSGTCAGPGTPSAPAGNARN